MRKIYCNECAKFLFETIKQSNGAAGAEAQSLGFVFKMPVLFTSDFTTLFFCDNQCAKNFYRKHIPKNEDATEFIESVKKDIPRMASDCAKAVGEFQDKLKSIKRKS